MALPAADPTADVLLTQEGGVARIQLNRPEAMNAVTATTGQQLLAAVRAVAAEDSVRAVVLTGSGRAFSAGADLKAASARNTPSGRPDLEWVLREIYNPLVMEIRRAPKPVIAAVNGVAVGVGFSFALACDVILAAEGAKFVTGFDKIGLSLDGGLSTLLAARAGFTRASELALLGQPLTSEQALTWNVVNEVIAADALDERAMALAEQLAAGPALAFAASKRLLNDATLGGLEAALDAEATSQGERVEGDEFVEGAMAFLERRAPKFA